MPHHHPRRLVDLSLVALAACVASSCLSDEDLFIACQDDTDCAANEGCIHRVCLELDRTVFVPGETCDEGLTPCDDACVDTTSDPDHCGRCGAVCAGAGHQSARCAASACIRTCAPGYRDLDGLPGCEAACDAIDLEVCNNIDDDCNGDVDDDIAPRACAQQRGVCAMARSTCTLGAWSACDDAAYAAAAAPDRYERVEATCDGADNDCDGGVDEGCCGPDERGDVVVDDGGAWVARALESTVDGWSVLATRPGVTGRGDLATWQVDGEGVRQTRQVLSMCGSGETLVNALQGDALVVVCQTERGAVVRAGDSQEALDELMVVADWVADGAAIELLDGRVAVAMQGAGDRGPELLVLDVPAGGAAPALRRVAASSGETLTSPTLTEIGRAPVLVALTERGSALWIERWGTDAGEVVDSGLVELRGVGAGRLAARVRQDQIVAVVGRADGAVETAELSFVEGAWSGVGADVDLPGARDVALGPGETPTSITAAGLTATALVVWDFDDPGVSWILELPELPAVGGWAAMLRDGGVHVLYGASGVLRVDAMDRDGNPWCGGVSDP